MRGEKQYKKKKKFCRFWPVLSNIIEKFRKKRGEQIPIGNGVTEVFVNIDKVSFGGTGGGHTHNCQVL